MSEVKNIPDGWVETTLGEVIQILDGDRGKNYPNGDDFSNSGYCLFLNTKNVPNRDFSFSETMFISKEKDNELGKGKLEREDFILTTRGTIGNFAFYSNDILYNNIRINSGMVILRFNTINKAFFKFYLGGNLFKNQVQSLQSGSAQPQLPIRDLKTFKIILPKISEQKSIASILTAFDDKIELLQAQNKTLEATAQTIFAEWFGKYNVDDELPSGWRIGKLSEIANLKSGFAFKAEDFIEESNFKAIKIKDLKGNGNISLSDVSAITEEITKLDRVQYFKLDEGDILLAMSGNTTGKIGVLPSSENEIYLNQRVGKFFMKDKKYNSFLYNFLMSGSFEEKILAMGYGSAQPNINPSQIENIDILYPDETKMNNYLKISNPIFEKVLKNNTQIQTLTKTRDELLPRLMSGKIRVKV